MKRLERVAAVCREQASFVWRSYRRVPQQESSEKSCGEAAIHDASHQIITGGRLPPLRPRTRIPNVGAVINRPLFVANFTALCYDKRKVGDLMKLTGVQQNIFVESIL